LQQIVETAAAEGVDHKNREASFEQPFGISAFLARRQTVRAWNHNDSGKGT
jgi:hypothetical protein